MANFAPELAKLDGIEGVYDNDPDDAGGETCFGIARVFHPGWEGWPLVDAARGKPGFPGILEHDPGVLAARAAFYKAENWDRFACDEWDQGLAGEIFEQAVNLGNGRVTEHLQRVCNALNHKGRYGADLVVDGAFGSNTLAALRKVVADKRSRAVQYGINGLQCAHYVQLAEKNAVKRKWTGGWLANRGGATP